MDSSIWWSSRYYAIRQDWKRKNSIAASATAAVEKKTKCNADSTAQQALKKRTKVEDLRANAASSNTKVTDTAPVVKDTGETEKTSIQPTTPVTMTPKSMSKPI